MDLDPRLKLVTQVFLFIMRQTLFLKVCLHTSNSMLIAKEVPMRLAELFYMNVPTVGLDMLTLRDDQKNGNNGLLFYRSTSKTCLPQKMT